MGLSPETIASFSRASYNVIHPDKDLHKGTETYEKMLSKVKDEVGESFDLAVAQLLCFMGFFVTHRSFSDSESMHEYDGKLYYEDGACLTTSGILDNPLDWMEDGWCIKADPDKVNFKKLEDMHNKSKGVCLSGESYEECIEL